MKHFRKFSLLLSFMVLIPALSWGINTSDTRMLSQPAISADKIAFIYAEDLWVANLDGTQPRRLTVDEGIESSPAFSPDGKWITFTAEYDGNRDVFILPSEGGIPVRLTWHPGADIARGFTPDGKNVLFISQRSTFTNRYFQLFTVPVTGGFPSQLEIPNAFYASYSPDGQSMAYTPIADRFQQWKNYRGGTISTVWIISLGDHSVVQIPKPAEGCNDTDPEWLGDKIYFMSDRNGEFNLFSFDPVNREIKQMTNFTDFPVLSIGADNDRIIYEQAGYLHLFDPAASASGKLTVAIATDLQELRPRYVSGGKYIRVAGISPTGARAVFDFRGEIITVPAEKGDPRNITQTAGIHEKYPAWSPDGNYIAYFSDSSGEYKLFIQPQDGKSEARSFLPPGTGFYGYPKWSPDSKKITFVDNGRNLYLLDVASGMISRIDSDELYRPGDLRDMMNDWSSDSRWFVYTRVTKTFFECIYIYSLEQGKSFKVTDGLSDASEPVFDRGGRYLYFFASTDAGPVNNWFDQSSADMRATRSIYLLTLQKDTISPFAKESDEEKARTEPAIAGKAPEASKKDKKAPAETTKPEKIIKIDLEGIQDRIVAFPVDKGSYSMLGSGKNDEVLYIVRSAGSGAQATLHKYDLKKRKDSEVMEMDGYMLSADGKKMLYSKRDTWGIAPSGEKPEAGKGILNTSDIQVKIEPLAEWSQIFDEAWRINRDYFYDPGMHGADWKAMK
ncbi:MAG: hypothetical protein MUP53_01190, partial [Bacteroidales bacterium]|nr:hypothetical protein [Bacteroidales bacterium]